MFTYYFYRFLWRCDVLTHQVNTSRANAKFTAELVVSPCGISTMQRCAQTTKLKVGIAEWTRVSTSAIPMCLSWYQNSKRSKPIQNWPSDAHSINKRMRWFSDRNNYSRLGPSLSKNTSLPCAVLHTLINWTLTLSYPYSAIWCYDISHCM